MKKYLYLIGILLCFTFAANAQKLIPYYGFECGTGILSSGIRDLRDSLPDITYKRLDDGLIFGGSIYGGFNYHKYDILFYLNWYGLFSDFKDIFDDSTETAVAGDLSSYTLLTKISYLLYETTSERLKIIGSLGYRNYSISGNLTMKNKITNIQNTYEDSFNKYHNIVLGAKTEYRLGDKTSIGLNYERFICYNPANSYYMEFVFNKPKHDLKDANLRLFVNLVKSERYGYLYLGLKGDTSIL